MPTPEPTVGQKAHLDGRDGDFTITAVSADKKSVEVISDLDPGIKLSGLAYSDLMFPEVENAD